MAGAFQTKALINVNDAILLQLPPDYDGAVSVEIGSLGNDGVTTAAGTFVLEASNNYDPQQFIGLTGGLTQPLLGVPVAGDWVGLGMKNPATAPASDISTLVAPGPLMGVAENLAYRWVRVRCTVAGATHGSMVTLGIGLF